MTSIFSAAKTALRNKRKDIQQGGAQLSDALTFTLKGYTEDEANAIAAVITGAHDIAWLQRSRQGGDETGVAFSYDMADYNRDVVHDFRYDAATRTGTFRLPSVDGLADIERNVEMFKAQMLKHASKYHISNLPGQVPDGYYYIAPFSRLGANDGERFSTFSVMAEQQPAFLGHVATGIAAAMVKAHNLSPQGDVYCIDDYHFEGHDVSAVLIPAAIFEPMARGEGVTLPGQGGGRGRGGEGGKGGKGRR